MTSEKEKRIWKELAKDGIHNDLSINLKKLMEILIKHKKRIMCILFATTTHYPRCNH